MTPGEVLSYARQQYNASNDSFFSDEELYRHVWFAQSILAKEANAIENTYTTTTVADQQEYEFPTNAIAIKRITWNGKALERITFREDDILTGRNAVTTATGEPAAYAVFDRVIYLRPIPGEAYTLKIFSYDGPQEVSSTSSLDVPDEMHLDLVNFVLWKMASKDQNFEGAKYYQEQWADSLDRLKRWSKRRQTMGSFRVVRDEARECLPWEVF